MRDRHLEQALRRSLGREIVPRRLEETIGLCRQITQEQAVARPEPRQGFWGFLSDIFRLEGPAIAALQAAALFLVCLFVYGAARDLRHVPAYVPLFVLAAMPVLFRGQYHMTSELEAVTRCSGAQLILARLLLAGAADLVCMTFLLGLEVHLCGSFRQLGLMILYCLVPYLVCMTAMLYLIRRRARRGIPLCAAGTLSSCLFWRVSSRVWPWLYELSAAGIWLAAFIVFTAFFARETYFIIQAGREGKMYGTVV